MCELLKAFAVVVVGLGERLDSKRQTLWKYVDTCSSMHTSLLTEYIVVDGHAAQLVKKGISAAQWGGKPISC